MLPMSILRSSRVLVGGSVPIPRPLLYDYKECVSWFSGLFNRLDFCVFLQCQAVLAFGDSGSARPRHASPGQLLTASW